MTAFHHALVFFGITAASIVGCVAYYHVVPFVMGLIGRFSGWLDHVTDRFAGTAVCVCAVLWVFGVCLLCASATWLRITDTTVFIAGIASLVTGTALFIKTNE